MSEPFIAEIIMFAGNFAPRGWAFCQGQILPIAQNTALFSILGTTYGGNGETTFALPDLRGRVPVGVGQGPGLAPYNLGEQGGTENVALTVSQLPAHNHSLNANSSDATQRAPAPGHVLAREATAQTAIYTAAAPDTTMSPQSIGVSGSSQPHANLQPYLGMNYIIALEGIFPSRN